MQAESIRCRENDDDEEGSDDENGEEDEDGDEDEEGEDDDDDEDEDEDEEERAEQGNRDVEMANGDDEAGKSLPSASSALLCLALNTSCFLGSSHPSQWSRPKSALHQPAPPNLVRRSLFIPAYTSVPTSLSIEAIVAIPLPSAVHSIASTTCSSFLLTGSQEGYVRCYDFWSSVNGGQMMTAQQRTVVGLGEGVSKAGVGKGWWGNEVEATRDETVVKRLEPVYSLVCEGDGLWALTGTQVSITIPALHQSRHLMVVFTSQDQSIYTLFDIPQATLCIHSRATRTSSLVCLCYPVRRAFSAVHGTGHYGCDMIKRRQGIELTFRRNGTSIQVRLSERTPPMGLNYLQWHSAHFHIRPRQHLRPMASLRKKMGRMMKKGVKRRSLVKVYRFRWDRTLFSRSEMPYLVPSNKLESKQSVIQPPRSTMTLPLNDMTPMST